MKVGDSFEINHDKLLKELRMKGYLRESLKVVGYEKSTRSGVTTNAISIGLVNEDEEQTILSSLGELIICGEDLSNFTNSCYGVFQQPIVTIIKKEKEKEDEEDVQDKSIDESDELV